MKRITMLLSMLLIVGLSLAENVETEWNDVQLQFKGFDPTEAAKPIRKTPINVPSIGINGHSLMLWSTIPNGEIVICNDSGEVRCIVPIDNDSNRIELPSYLSGIYIIEIRTNQYHFWGYINL